LSDPQWSSVPPSASAGGAAGVHAPLEGTQTCAELPEVAFTRVHVSPEAHWLEVEHEVAQYRSPANCPHTPLAHSFPDEHGAHSGPGGPASRIPLSDVPPRSTFVPHATSTAEREAKASTRRAITAAPSRTWGLREERADTRGVRARRVSGEEPSAHPRGRSSIAFGEKGLDAQRLRLLAERAPREP
jgi:hypothetical protein